MGFSGISIVQLLIILVIVIMIFGTKKLRNLGQDVGGGIKGIREGFSDEDKDASIHDVVNEVAAAKKAFEDATKKFTKGD